jgi:hypothetical protein
MSGSGAKKRHGDYLQSLSLCPRRFPSVALGTTSRRVHGCATWAVFTEPGFCFIKTVGHPRRDDGVDGPLFPPCGLVAEVVDVAVMSPAQGDGEFVADLPPHGAGLSELKAFQAPNGVLKHDVNERCHWLRDPIKCVVEDDGDGQAGAKRKRPSKCHRRYPKSEAICRTTGASVAAILSPPSTERCTRSA